MMNPGVGNTGPGHFPQQIPQSHMMMPPGHVMPQGQGQFMNYPQGQFQGQGMMMRQPMFNPNMMGMRPMGAPPSYSEAMNHSSVPRQRMHGPRTQMQRPSGKTEEQIQREKYFQQQQAKLKQFKTSGTSSLDPNKLVDSIFGTTSAAKPKPSNPSLASAVVDTDDGFGDFLGSQPNSEQTGFPTNQSVSSPNEGNSFHSSTSGSGTSHQTAILDVGTSQQETVRHTGNSPQNMTVNSGISPDSIAVNSKDLKKMMLESCDLNAPQKARLFHKPALKEINPVHVQAATHHTSQNARRWDTSEELSQLFLQEAVKDESTKPKPKKQVRQRRPSAPAAWLSDDSLLPPVYKQVLEASVLNGHINTERLYPILMLSGLPREVMGRLWSLCNKTTPGELTVKELYQLLAVIALVQNNYNVENLEILCQCPQAPVPFFATGSSQTSLPQSAPSPSTPGSPGLVSGAPASLPVASQPQQTFSDVSQAVGHIPPGSHFVGNQPGPQSPVSTVSPPGNHSIGIPNQSALHGMMGSVGSLPGHVTGLDVTAVVSSVPATLPVTQLPPSGVLSGQRQTVFKASQVAADDDDDFADFQGASVSPPASASTQTSNVKQQPAIAPVKDASKFVYQPPQSDSQKAKTLSPDLAVSTVQNFFGSDDSSETTSPDDEYLDGYKSADSKPSDSTSQFSTDQSEGEDFKNFENYLDEFQRKKEMQEKESPLHRPVSKFLGKEKTPASPSKILKKPAQPVQKLFTAPAPKVKQSGSVNQPSADDFSDFADFQSAPVLPDVNQSIKTVTPSGKTLAPPVSHSDQLKSSASASDLIGEEDKYAALRSLEFAVEDNEEPTGLPVESNADSKADEVDEDWADFQTVSNDKAVPSTGNIPVASVDMAAISAKTSDTIFTSAKEETSHSHLGWGFEPFPKSSSQPQLSGTVESQASVKSDIDNSADWADFQEGTDDFTDFQSSEPDLSQKSEEKKGELVNVKKDKLDATEILGLFKVKSEPVVNVRGRDDDKTFPTKADISVSSAMNKLHGIVSDNKEKEHENVRQTHLSEEDDFMKPPPVDHFHDTDHEDISRGYDLEDFMGTNTQEKKKKYGVYGANETFVVEGHKKKDISEVGKVTVELTKDSDTDSISSKDIECDVFRGKLGITKGEDSQSVASLDLVVSKSLQSFKDITEGDTQSVSSNDFSHSEAGVNINKDILAESKSIDSLELRKEETAGTESGQEGSDKETREESPSKEQQDNVKPQFDLGPQNNGLPIISDRYSAISHDIPGSDKHSYEWQRCLENCCKMVQEANNTFNSISSSSICNEVIRSSQGSQYIQGIIEIYKVVCKITVTMKKSGIYNDHLSKLLKDIDLAWNNLAAFLVGGSVMPDEKSLDFSHGALLCDDTTSQYKACGVCLLDVDMKVKGLNTDNDNSRLTYGGRQYHAPCANFWINCVESTLPALRLPELI